MKAAVVTNGGEGGKLAKEICDALGLKHVQAIDIHMAVNEIFTVTAKFYLEIDGIRQFPAILRKFELIAVIDKKDLEDTTVMGDEVASFCMKERAVPE